MFSFLHGAREVSMCARVSCQTLLVRQEWVLVLEGCSFPSMCHTAQQPEQIPTLTCPPESSGLNICQRIVVQPPPAIQIASCP